MCLFLADDPLDMQEFVTMEPLDAADRAILDLLRGKGRATIAELAAATGLSASACSRRLRRLEDRRTIRGYRAIIDPKADGRGLTAFVAVRLVRHQREHIQRFQDSTREVPEIIECHHVTGTFDYLLRVEVPDLPAYERVHADRLAALHNVGQLVTYISMTDLTDP
jgi:Lrp/AsnC family transcriptional regulator, leucine-responsive regulatory protein